MSRWAWALVGLTSGGVATQTGLLIAAGVPLVSRAALDRTFPVIPVAVLVGAVVGALIIGRHPGHRVGRLLVLGQAGAALGLAAQTLAATGAALGVATPVAVTAAWLGALLGANYALTLLAALLLLVPDGRLGTPFRRAAMVLVAGSYGLHAVAQALAPPGGTAGPVAFALGLAGDVGTTLGLVAAAAVLFVRLRRARGEERQQLRWIAVAALFLAAALALMVGVSLARGDVAPWPLQALFFLGYLAVPVATGFAVLRYRLYDVDLIIGSAVRLGVLAGFVTAGYVLVVVVLGRLLGGVGLSLAAYVAVALAFQPLRRRVDGLADRVVHGRRAAPHDSLAAFVRGLGASRSDPQLPEMVARACAEVTDARWAAATVTVTGAPDLTARWPAEATGEPQLTIPVEHRGEVLGRIDLGLPPGRSLTRGERRFVTELAAQAGLAFRNVALGAALQARAADLARDGEALAASRRRLVRAADAERARVAAAIRRDVGAPLDGMPAALAGLDSAALAEQEDVTARAIDALRVITRGVAPPLLARRGLGAALEDFARESPDRPSLHLDGVAGRRLPGEIEMAAYACCVEAVRGMHAGAELRAEADAHRLAVTVRGTPREGADPHHLVDRVEAIGGRITVDPAAVRAEFPVGRSIAGTE